MGGGVFASRATIDNSAIVDNSTAGTDAIGGGAFVRFETSLTNSTLTGNSTQGAGASGGGIYHLGSSSSPDFLALTNSIALGNTSQQTPEDETGFGGFSSGLALAGGNIVGDEFTLGDVIKQMGITVADVFAAVGDNHGVSAGQLADNGGSLPSVALAKSSANPAINSGDSSLQNQTEDVRGTGFARVRAGDVDLGAFEVQNDAPVITSDGGAATATVTVFENSTDVTNLEAADDADAEGRGLTYTLTALDEGGQDNTLFTLDAATGQLTFTMPPNYAAALDADGDNIYEVQVTVTDSAGGQDTQSLAVQVIEAPALTVDSVAINDGEAQRSMVRSIDITFNRDDVVVNESAFEVINTTTGQSVALSVQTNVSSGRTIARITFHGSGVVGGSLSDGTWQLRIKADAVASAPTMDDDHVDEFFRRFGDANGDGMVDAVDFLAFRRTYRRTQTSSLFDDSFDSDGDGDVDAADFLAFRRNYLR